MSENKVVYFKELPSFIEGIAHHLGYQIHIMQIKEMYSLSYEVYSKEEEKIKDYIDTYFYLLNNVSNRGSQRIITKSIFLLTGKRIKKEKVENILSSFFSIKEEINIKKIIDFSFRIASLVKNRKDCYMYRFMIMNYLLIYYGFKQIRIFEHDYPFMDKAIKEYKEGNRENLEKIVILKEQSSKELPADYYSNLSEITLKDITQFFIINKNILIHNYKVESLAIFGSFAKGKERLDSDIDLIIKFEEYIPILKKNKYKEEIRKLVYQQFNRFCDIHIESETINENEIKIFKDYIKII